MLTQQLRELEQHGLITRTVHPVVPPHVDYALTPLGQTTIPVVEALRTWGVLYRRRRGTGEHARAAAAGTRPRTGGG